MGVIERRARQKASLRREILTAASRLFAEEGYDAVTMRKLAARIEYSPTTIYLYFRDKRELFAAVCEDTFSQLGHRFEREARNSGTPMGHLRACLQTYIEFGVAHPHHYAIAFLTPGSGPKKEGAVAAASQTTIDAIATRLAACRDRGALRLDDLELTAQTLFAGIHGVTALLIAGHRFSNQPQKALIAQIVSTLMAGVGAPIAAPSDEPAEATRRMPRPARSRDFSFMD